MFGVNRHWATRLIAACGLLSCFAVHGADIELYTYEVAPFAVYENGKPSGLLIEVLDELFKRSDLSYQIQFVPLKRAMITVQRQAHKCVLPVARSQEREVQFQWISPVLITRFGLYSKPEQSFPLTTLIDAKPYRIGSFLGSGIGEYLANLGFTVELSSTTQQNFAKLNRDRIDLWAAELISAKHIAQANGVSLEPQLVFYTALGAMACNHNMPQAQIQLLQTQLNMMYQDGFMGRLYHSYGVDI
ncbi:transporter substrate-binding domain-containing protein [Shewanella sp. Scap07]|uniref:substrate-binding periplasmic protein n=1 Tax=Shewanella sp. Scap07 TaxID=2589987 RepID=UPI0015C07E20|nr:transporter substrate-binding domain-containing protein [Shewanella sp. Scap07]QLE85751.1 transporter substrate-binding domain-containing protein [Shewanella sp. Scap07]